MTDTTDSPNHASSPRDHGFRTSVTRGFKRRSTDPAWIARAAGSALSIVSLGFVLLFLLAIGQYGELSLFTRPLPLRLALVLPNLIVVLTAMTAIGVVFAWWNRYWSLRRRLHQTVLALLGFGFSWQLTSLGLSAL